MFVRMNTGERRKEVNGWDGKDRGAWDEKERERTVSYVKTRKEGKRTEQNRREQNRTEQNRAEQNGTKWN